MENNLPKQGFIDILRKIYSYQITQCIATACKFGIFEFLENAMDYEDLAQKLTLDSNSLFRLLRFLKVEGLLEEVEPGTFINTESGSFLSINSKISLKNLAIMNSSQFYWTCWQNLTESIKTGKPASEYCFNTDMFTYLQNNPEDFNCFNLSMESLSSIDKQDLPTTYDFSCFNTVIDVGGGTGIILFSLLEKYPTLRGKLYDLKSPIDRGRELFKIHPAYNRCEFLEGSFLEKVPLGGECYILRHIIHDWDDENSIKILKNCRQSMNQAGKILVIETIVDDSKVYPVFHMKDLHMLVALPRGKKRTLQQYEELFKSSGLKLSSVITLPSQMSIMELIID